VDKKVEVPNVDTGRYFQPRRPPSNRSFQQPDLRRRWCINIGQPLL